eukprot:8916026-Pyramimonas_sp.AAC.1
MAVASCDTPRLPHDCPRIGRVAAGPLSSAALPRSIMSTSQDCHLIDGPLRKRKDAGIGVAGP